DPRGPPLDRRDLFEGGGAGLSPTKMGPRQRFRAERLQQQLHYRHSFAGRWRSNHASVGVCAPAVPRDFRGTGGGRRSNKSLILFLTFAPVVPTSLRSLRELTKAGKPRFVLA